MAMITDKQLPENLAKDIRRAWRVHFSGIRIYDMPEETFNNDKEFGEIIINAIARVWGEDSEKYQIIIKRYKELKSQKQVAAELGLKLYKIGDIENRLISAIIKNEDYGIFRKYYKGEERLQ